MLVPYFNKISKRVSRMVLSLMLMMAQMTPFFVFSTSKVNAIDSTASLPFSDSFGSSDVNNVTSWDDNDGNDSATRIVGNSSARSGSVTTGHVRMGINGWVCRTVNATGYENLSLTYYWNGDNDADNPDDGFVEYKTSGSCSDASGWTSLASHGLNDDTNWSNQESENLPDALDGQTFKLRFRSDADNSNEEFRLDDVAITGSVVTQAVANPALTQACGLDITLALDNSQSITTDQRTQMKSAMTSFTTALTGTPTQFAVVHFGNGATT